MKNKIYETLKTPYIENMDKDKPWDIYPRPQLVRDSYASLNGSWDFAICETPNIPDEFTEKILVPFPPESLLSGIERRVPTDAYMVYRRNFTIPEGFIKDRVLLHFGAVDETCTVFVNGIEVGKNEGGYIPFFFDITDTIEGDCIDVTIIAKDRLSKEFPYGKQCEKRGGMWYTPVSGIWQSVWLESVPRDHIESISIEQNAKFAKIRVNSKAEHKVLILEETKECIAFDGDEVTVSPKSQHLWSPEDPYLYNFTIQTDNDKIESYFALREIGIATVSGKERILLNGKPYFFSALLDQGYYPDGIFLPATPDGYKEDILLAKRLGFNTLRKHIKIEPLIFYYLCDKLGIVVFQDMVNNSSYSFLLDTALPTIGFKKLTFPFRHTHKRTQEIFISEMKKTAMHLFNTPSVLLYTIFNEGWGEFRPDDAYRSLKELDSSRLIDSTSGWFFGNVSDLDSRHVYFRAPDIKKPTGKPQFLSEFGGFSCRIPEHLFGSKNYGYSIYSDTEALSDAIYHLYTDGVLPLIEDGLSAAVYTQLSDVEDETNGLITYDRRFVKIDEARMIEANNALYSKFHDVTKS